MSSNRTDTRFLHPTLEGRNRFAVWLTRERQKRGWSVAKAAREFGVSRSAVTRWSRTTESDGVFNSPQFASLNAISKSFGVPMQDIFDILGYENPQDWIPNDPLINEIVSMLPLLPESELEKIRRDLQDRVQDLAAQKAMASKRQ